MISTTNQPLVDTNFGPFDRIWGKATVLNVARTVKRNPRVPNKVHRAERFSCEDAGGGFKQVSKLQISYPFLAPLKYSNLLKDENF